MTTKVPDWWSRRKNCIGLRPLLLLGFLSPARLQLILRHLPPHRPPARVQFLSNTCPPCQPLFEVVVQVTLLDHVLRKQCFDDVLFQLTWTSCADQKRSVYIFEQARFLAVCTYALEFSSLRPSPSSTHPTVSSHNVSLSGQLVTNTLWLCSEHRLPATSTNSNSSLSSRNGASRTRDTAATFQQEHSGCDHPERWPTVGIGGPGANVRVFSRTTTMSRATRCHRSNNILCAKNGWGFTFSCGPVVSCSLQCLDHSVFTQAELVAVGESHYPPRVQMSTWCNIRHKNSSLSTTRLQSFKDCDVWNSAPASRNLG